MTEPRPLRPAATEPPPPLLQLRPTARPAALCRACRTIHRPAEPCGPSTLGRVA